MLLALPKHYLVYSVLERKATDADKKTGGTVGAKFNLQGLHIANAIVELLADPELDLVRSRWQWLHHRY